jgi:hypothetical protein
VLFCFLELQPVLCYFLDLQLAVSISPVPRALARHFIVLQET